MDAEPIGSEVHVLSLNNPLFVNEGRARSSRSKDPMYAFIIRSKLNGFLKRVENTHRK